MEDRTAILQRELDDLKRQITALEKKLAEKPDYGLGAGAPAVTQWELDKALWRQITERTAKIEQMLSQAIEATYGICERCGESIHPDRLAVLPDTSVCIECARTSGN
jgi:RNA polymerase-binding transcription factor DksA